MGGPAFLKKNMRFVRTWWHRCASLPYNINTFFFTFLNVSRIWLFFLASIIYASSGRHRVSKILTIVRWSLTTIEIIWFVDIGCACIMIIVSVNECARGQGWTWQVSCRKHLIASLIPRPCDFLGATLIRWFSRWLDSLLVSCRRSRPQH